MDPKAFAKLDPKLRETYERVMGTSVPQKPTIVPSVVTTPPAATPVPAANTPIAPISTTQPPASTAPVTPQATGNSVVPPELATERPHTHSTIAVHTAVADTSHSDEKKEDEADPAAAVPAWKKILFIVLGIAFFGAYAIFWLLFFKVKLPF